MRLSELKRGHKATILGIGTPPVDSAELPQDLPERLLEVGFEDGLQVELLETGPLGGDPLAVMLDGMIVAIRKIEADLIEVRP